MVSHVAIADWSLAPKGAPGFKGSMARKSLESYKNSLKSQLQGRQREAFKKMIEDYKTGEQYIDKDTLGSIFQEIKDSVKP
jgi:Tfp pilus assembly protein FimT